MADFNLIMPKMGESIMEATILRWLKKPGDMVALDETLLEIATDKVDSEIPSPVAGRLDKILFQENAVVPVGQTIAIIATEAKAGTEKGNGSPIPPAAEKPKQEPQAKKPVEEVIEAKPVSQTSRPQAVPYVPSRTTQTQHIPSNSGGRFYSPLVRNIASSEGIAQAELDQISGSGMGGRVTKYDILSYLEGRTQTKESIPAVQTSTEKQPVTQKQQEVSAPPVAQKPSASSDGSTE